MSFACSRTRRRRRTQGVTSIEFALILIPFMILILGTFDLGRYFLTLNSLAAFTNAAARYCMINPETFPLVNNLLNTGSVNLADSAPFLDPTVLQSNLSVSCLAGTANQAANGMEQATVTAKYPFSPITPGLDLLNMTITDTVTFNY